MVRAWGGGPVVLAGAEVGRVGGREVHLQKGRAFDGRVPVKRDPDRAAHPVGLDHGPGLLGQLVPTRFVGDGSRRRRQLCRERHRQEVLAPKHPGACPPRGSGKTDGTVGGQEGLSNGAPISARHPDPQDGRREYCPTVGDLAHLLLKLSLIHI